MKRHLIISSLTSLLLGCLSVQAQRVDTELKDQWRFVKGDVPEASATKFDDSAWQTVTVPHTWNHADEPLKKGPDGLTYKGPGWYRRTLEFPSNPAGQRTFLRFEAAAVVSDVYLNGTKLGQHRGGFTAFTYEITGLIQPGPNQLAVRVDNGFFGDVPPLSGDFTVFGGIYRPVHLIQVGPLCISPLIHGGSGIAIRQSKVSHEQAQIEVTTHLSDAAGTNHEITLKTTVVDTEGHAVSTAETIARITDAASTQKLTVSNPHLWNGIDDPYLYTVKVEVIHEGKVVDQLTQPLGLRYFNFDKDKGFSLNGKPYRLRGVCRHQDVGDHGWAATPQDMDLDMALIREMGANAVRLAHYPHPQYFLQLCDRYGIIAWSEVPLVNTIGATEDYVTNASQQLEELIAQYSNHPAIVTWGLWNELQGGNPALPVIQHLNDLAHRLDPTRPTTAASFSGSEKWCPDATKVTDLLATNTYPGWYRSTPQDMNTNLDKFREFAPNQPLGVSEYGAGASIHHHQQGMVKGPAARGEWHPEEWQAITHEAHWKAIEARPFIWGSFVWNMFDFASAHRKEGDTFGINDKGLVTRDRKVRKDAFYFYKASWSPEPMVHITSSRHTERTEAATPVKIYTNAGNLKLTLNGKALPAGQQDGVIHTWQEVVLQPGKNTLVATAERDGKTVSDQVTWSVVPKAKP